MIDEALKTANFYYSAYREVVDGTQKFFDDLAGAARSPGCGDHYRTFVATVLIRAQEANLYTPETK